MLKKVFNSLKTRLIVQREQQIGLSYKTLIDLWKVEATAGSHVPCLIARLVWAPMKQWSLKKWVLFQSKSLDDAKSVIKGWILLLQLYMISFPELRGQAAGLPGAEKPLSHAFIVSHFTFKTYMSVNLTTFTVHICHWAGTQIFIKEQKLMLCTMNVLLILVMTFSTLVSWLALSVFLQFTGLSVVCTEKCFRN